MALGGWEEQGEYLGQKVAVKNIKCDVTAQAFLDETAVMT